MSGKIKIPRRITGDWSEEAKLFLRFYYDNSLTEEQLEKIEDKLNDKLHNKTEEEIKEYLDEAKSLYSKMFFSSDYFKNWHPGLIWGLPAPEGFKPGDEY